MRLYLCGQSALAVLRYLRSINDDALFEPPARVRTLAKAIHGLRDLDGLSPTAERLVGHAGETVHALVADKTQVVSRGRLATHLWGAKVPAGAFLKLTDDLYVSSPAFVFLQMARKLDIVALAKLGMEFCGFYSLPEKHTPYVPNSVDETIYEISPVTTARRIARLCESADDSVIGVDKARMVAGWLADNAASPAEANTYLLLCLPKRRGGYGLPRPIFNPKVTVATASTVEVRFPDLFWEDKSVDIEYQSDLSHSGNYKRYTDSKRHVQLTVNKISVLPLTKAQLYNTDDFHELAIGLHRLLGVQVRYLDEAWKNRRDELRSSVLFS